MIRQKDNTTRRLLNQVASGGVAPTRRWACGVLGEVDAHTKSEARSKFKKKLREIAERSFSLSEARPKLPGPVVRVG